MVQQGQGGWTRMGEAKGHTSWMARLGNRRVLNGQRKGSSGKPVGNSFVRSFIPSSRLPTAACSVLRADATFTQMRPDRQESWGRALRARCPASPGPRRRPPRAGMRSQLCAGCGVGTCRGDPPWRQRGRRAESESAERRASGSGKGPPRREASSRSGRFTGWGGRRLSRVTSAPCHVVSPDRGGAREAGGMVGSVSGGSEKSEVPGGPVRVSGSRPHDG